MSQLPASTVRTLRPQAVRTPAQRASTAFASGAVPGPVVVPPPPPAVPAKTFDLDVIGPRKLIRPTLPNSAARARRFQRHDEPVLFLRPAASLAAFSQETAHAETFYLQKQVQAQTSMVFVLDNNDKIEGCIEWYDRNAIKVRCTSSSPFRTSRPGEPAPRMLIYKSAIKYLYKSSENQPQF
jgi:hypothetical protein